MESLSKLKVIELASVLAGPAVGQFFAELGADVIKVENANGGGDVTRSWRSPGEKTDDRSAYFTCVNWGKRSVTADLRDGRGRELLHKLITDADIAITSFKPGDAQKLGADYETLRAINKRLIYGEITGYGHTDPRVGYDAVIQAESGFMSLNGESDGSPLKIPVALMDLLAGHHLKEGLLLALWDRERTGQGRRVSVSLYDAAIASLGNQASNWLVGNNTPQRQGSLHPNIAPYGETVITKDGQTILLAVGTDKQFRSLLEILDLKDLISDTRFITNEKRVTNRKALHTMLSQAASAIDAPDLMSGIQRSQIPAGVVTDVPAAINSVHGRNLIIEGGGLTGLRSMVARFDNSWVHSTTLRPPPHLGEHNLEIAGNSRS
jgi:crotonobetainyl-CoA:carnitine CoA-transferase CaiB-like acyl-CoA transferase